MYLPGDPKLKECSKQIREMEKKYPDRNWRSGLTKEQQKQVEKWRKEGNNKSFQIFGDHLQR